MHLFTSFDEFRSLLSTRFGFLVHSNGPSKPRNKESLRRPLEYWGPVRANARLYVQAGAVVCIALSCQMMRRDVVGTRIRDQGEELTAMQEWATKNGNSKDKHHCAQTLPRQQKPNEKNCDSSRTAEEYPQPKSFLGVKFWALFADSWRFQCKVLGATRTRRSFSVMVAAQQNENGLATRITFRKLICSSHVFGANAKYIIAVNRHAPHVNFRTEQRKLKYMTN